MKYSLLVLGFMLCVPSFFFAQEIYLENASFEGDIAQNAVPKGWQNCSSSKKIWPDIESHEVTDYQRNSRAMELPLAIEGNTYLSLYTDNYYNYTAVEQQLSTPLEPGKCYLFNIYACYFVGVKNNAHSKKKSIMRPIKLRVWGGSVAGERGELLGETEVIRSRSWKKQNFVIEPLEGWAYFILEAYFDESKDQAYDGKILLDNASPILDVDCETIDFETGEILGNSTYDPVYEYYKYMNNYLEENWDRPLFVEEGADLTEGAKILIEDIARITADAEFYKIYFAISYGKDGLQEERTETLKTTLKEAGLKGRMFHVRPLSPSDYQKEWVEKNKEVWVRIEQI